MDLTDAQDRRLAEQAAAGDDGAFTALVDRHRVALVRFVARRTGRSTIAEDAVQEAMLSAHRALRGGAPPQDVKAWLHTLAWRRAVDLLRREAPVAHASEWEDVRAVDGLDVVVGDAIEFDRMLGHWRRLPHRQRHALAMSVLEGRSLEEIGQELGVSPVAAKSLVARSRRSLAHAMVSTGDPCEPVVRRRRHLFLFPPALVERFREAATFASYHEQPASLVTKACAGACAAALAGGGTTAVVAVAPVKPLITAPAERPVKEKKERNRATKVALRTADRARVTSAPVATATPVPARTAAPARPQTPDVTTAASTGTGESVGTVRRPSRTPTPHPASEEPQADPQPAATPTPAPTAAPTPEPAATP
jgi:RNA polymerase sigma factor (sigma-70 family)